MSYDPRHDFDVNMVYMSVIHLCFINDNRSLITSDINKTKSTEINIFIRKSFKVNLCGNKHFFDIHNIPGEGGILLALKWFSVLRVCWFKSSQPGSTWVFNQSCLQQFIVCQTKHSIRIKQCIWWVWMLMCMWMRLWI